MSILESIKGERKLSLNHWRFRILHWAFNVKNPDPQYLSATGLPMFLYTHYCPLFHLTNLIALLSPLILLIKLIMLIFSAFVACLSLLPIERIFNFFQKFAPAKEKPIQLLNTEELCAAERRRCIKLICNFQGDNFDVFWECMAPNFLFLSKTEAQALYEEYMPKVLAARERHRLRKENWRQRIIFWTNFSRVFIKSIMNVLYCGFFMLLLYSGYCLSGPAWNFLCWCGELIAWLFTDTVSLAFLWLLAKITFWTAIIMAMVVAIIRTGIAGIVANTIGNGLVYISPPLYILTVPFRWIGSGFTAICEFVSMFYEENCPPIKIVNEEEAVVESQIGGEEV